MIPNILTTIRLILVPIFAYCMLGIENYSLAAAVFIVAGLSDIVDGYIARRFDMITDFGKIYDPFVDKLMQITAVVCLVINEVIPIGLLLIVIAKEVTMIITGGILYLNKIVVSSNWYGKAATTIFYAIVLIMIIWRSIPQIAEMILIIILISAMCIAAGGYIIDTVKNFNDKRVQN